MFNFSTMRLATAVEVDEDRLGAFVLAQTLSE